MQCIDVNSKDRVITTKTQRLLRKPLIRKFKATHRQAGRFWQWLELPNNEIVTDGLSFQLDAWLANPPSE